MVAVVSAACGSSGDQTETAVPATPAPLVAAPVTDGSSSPGDADGPSVARPDVPGVPDVSELDFVAPTVAGSTLAGAELAGTDTIAWFWAPW